jgi:aerobic-type carbon monoxide dehydrogenase small subunit (CoxS/CutS family)
MELTVNGRAYRVHVPADEPLLWVLRDDLGLTGTKPGCGEGVCGCCLVLVDGQPTYACQLTAAEAVGRPITTIEGLATVEPGAEPRLHPVQQAFLDAQAGQCGWCLSGQILSTVALLAAHPAPEPAEVDAAMDRVYCRCGVYGRIRAAIQRAAEVSHAETAGGVG